MTLVKRTFDDGKIIHRNSSRNVQYIEQVVTAMNAENAGSKIASMSMGIQKGKYDGTTEMYKKLTN